MFLEQLLASPRSANYYTVSISLHNPPERTILMSTNRNNKKNVQVNKLVCFAGCVAKRLIHHQHLGSQLSWTPELEKTRVNKKWGLFFPQHPPPHFCDYVWIQSWNARTTLGQTFPRLLEPGFWILTKGVNRQPVQGQLRPVLGMHPLFEWKYCGKNTTPILL